MDISNRDFIHGDPSSTPTNSLPPWLSKQMGPTTSSIPPLPPPPPSSSPSVTLSLSPSTFPPPAWLQSSERRIPDPSFASSSYQLSYGENNLVSEVLQCCNELEEKQKAWAAHKKEADWRLKRVELQLESEKSCKRREKMEETEAKIKALRHEQQVILDRIEADYKEQFTGLRRDAEIKEQKLCEQWAAKHRRLMDFLHQLGYQP